MINDERFTRPLYSVAGAARLVGMNPSTLRAWSQARATANDKGGDHPSIITTLDRKPHDKRRIPFIGLAEATVVQAFRKRGVSLQRVRKALEVLASQGELEHALASRHLYTDGADILYRYADQAGDKQLRLLTVVSSGQSVFHEVVDHYLKRITFDDAWATELILPVTKRRLLRVLPDVALGDALFMNGGAPLSAVRSRAAAGESLSSISADFDTPIEDLREGLAAIWPGMPLAP